jgi:hypothetical protein
MYMIQLLENTNTTILQALGFNKPLLFGRYHKLNSLVDPNTKIHKNFYIYEPYNTELYRNPYSYTARTIKNLWNESRTNAQQSNGPLVLSFGSFLKRYKNKKK